MDANNNTSIAKFDGILVLDEGDEDQFDTETFMLYILDGVIYYGLKSSYLIMVQCYFIRKYHAFQVNETIAKYESRVLETTIFIILLELKHPIAK